MKSAQHTTESRPITGTDNGDEVLIAKHIAPHPHESGRAKAYFPKYGFYVVNVINRLLENGRNVAETASVFEMPEDAILAALAFYRQNKEVIDAKIIVDLDQWDSTFVPNG